MNDVGLWVDGAAGAGDHPGDGRQQGHVRCERAAVAHFRNESRCGMITEDRLKVGLDSLRPDHLGSVEANLYAFSREERGHAGGILAIPGLQ